MKNKNIAFIFARGGSKGLKDKNILKIGGRSMVGRAVDIAKEIKEVSNIFVSTDCDKIASIGKSHGANIIKRPEELARDNSPEWEAWKHAINYVINQNGSFERFISLPPTAPLRSARNVQDCIEKLQGDVDIVVTMSKSKRNPSFNMVEKSKCGKLQLLEKGLNIRRRQEAKVTYDLATVAYVTTPKYVLSTSTMWQGNVHGIEVEERNAIDIDTEHDYLVANLLAKHFECK